MLGKVLWRYALPANGIEGYSDSLDQQETDAELPELMIEPGFTRRAKHGCFVT